MAMMSPSQLIEEFPDICAEADGPVGGLAWWTSVALLLAGRVHDKEYGPIHAHTWQDGISFVHAHRWHEHVHHSNDHEAGLSTPGTMRNQTNGEALPR